MIRPSFVRVPSASLVLVLVGACANGPDITATPNNTCLTAADCASDAVCDATQHACIATGATAEVVFYATPPAGTLPSVAAPTQTEPRTVDTASTFDIAMRPAVQVTGAISALPWHDPMNASSTPSATNLSARVEFRRQGTGSVVSPISVEATAVDGAAATMRTYSWSRALPEGTYDVTIVPEAAANSGVAADVPPWTLPSELVLPGDGNTSFLAQYPTPQIFQGVLQDNAGAPIANVRVQAVTVIDGAVRSTTAVTGPTGHFGIVLSPELMSTAGSAGMTSLVEGAGSRDWALEITAVPHAGALPGRIAYRIGRNALPGGGYTRDAATLTLATRAPFTLDDRGGCGGCYEVSGTVEGTLPAGSHTNVTSGTVDFTSSTLVGLDTSMLVGHSLVFTAHVTLDASGGYDAQLLPGRYDTVITPNVPASFAVTDLTANGPEPFVVGDHAQHARVLEVERLVPVTGRIRTQTGSADLSGFQVTAVPSAALLTTSTLTVAQALARATAPQLTIADGSYALFLDPGPYRIVVMPPPTAALAPFVTARDVDVASNRAADDTSQPLTFDVGSITLTAPVQVRGHVLGADNAPIGGASIMSYVRLRSALTPARTAASTLDVPLGTVTSADDGAWSMLLSGVAP